MSSIYYFSQVTKERKTTVLVWSKPRMLSTISLTLVLSSRFKNVVVSLGIALMICILPMVFYIALPTDVATWINMIIPSTGVGLVTSILYCFVDYVYLNIGQVSVWLPYAMIVACIVEIPIFILMTIRNYIVFNE